MLSGFKLIYMLQSLREDNLLGTPAPYPAWKTPVLTVQVIIVMVLCFRRLPVLRWFTEVNGAKCLPMFGKTQLIRQKF